MLSGPGRRRFAQPQQPETHDPREEDSVATVAVGGRLSWRTASVVVP
jgi:hypothetical protein